MSDPEAIHHGAGNDHGAESDTEDLTSAAQVSADRIASLFFVSGAFLLLFSSFLLTVQLAEELLRRHFEQVVNESIQIPATPQPPGQTIRDNLIERVDHSAWVRIWGVKVNVTVMARGGREWLYVNGHPFERRYRNRDPKAMAEIHARLLPATATVAISVDHRTALFISILIVYAAIFLIGFFVHNRNVVDRHSQAINDARESRDQAARTATRIKGELESVRAQLREVEPVEEQHREEIARLHSEQQELQSRLEALAARERELRGQADRVAVLEEDSRVFEEMLDEATASLAAKEAEVRELAQSLKRSNKGAGTAGRKSKKGEVLSKRIRTLYPQLEIDDRAIDDIAALPDEATRLRAEECIKRLSEDADNLGIRRKVKALRNQLPIYELGFAGKRRIYYARVKDGRLRVLVVGDKKTQRSDLDYLETFPKGSFVS